MLCAEDIEELRRQNIADNQKILEKIKADIKQWLPTFKPKETTKPKKRPQINPVEIRRNPPRASRLSGPFTRSRSGSVSSEASSSASSDAWSIPSSDIYLDEEDAPPAKVRRISFQREIKSAEEITEEDLEMVAVNVRDKSYDREYGTTCHQCRQKTDDMKTICRSEECFGVKGQFCGPCLRNRYGEDAKAALKDPNWMCPPCRGICNCSFCRKHQGKTCTGILIHLARENGYTNVNDYLQSLREKAVC